MLRMGADVIIIRFLYLTILFYLYNVAGIVLSNMFEIERSKITVKLSPLDLKMMDSFRIRVGLNKHVTSSYYQQSLFLLLFESLRITILFLSSFFSPT